MRASDRKSFYAALELARTAASDPQAAVRDASNIARLLSAAAPSFRDDAAPTMLVTPTVVQSVVVANTGITPTARIPIKWPRNGRVCGISGTVAQGHALTSHVTISLLMEGVSYLFTNGSGEGFIPLSILSGANANGLAYFPVDWRVTPQQNWTIQYSSMDPLPGAGSTTYTPYAVFMFEAEE